MYAITMEIRVRGPVSGSAGSVIAPGEFFRRTRRPTEGNLGSRGPALLKVVRIHRLGTLP